MGAQHGSDAVRMPEAEVNVFIVNFEFTNTGQLRGGRQDGQVVVLFAVAAYLVGVAQGEALKRADLFRFEDVNPIGVCGVVAIPNSRKNMLVGGFHGGKHGLCVGSSAKEGDRGDAE